MTLGLNCASSIDFKGRLDIKSIKQLHFTLILNKLSSLSLPLNWTAALWPFTCLFIALRLFIGGSWKFTDCNSDFGAFDCYSS